MSETAYPPDDPGEPPAFDGPGIDPILQEPPSTTGKRRLNAAARVEADKLLRRQNVARAMLSQPAGREFMAWLLYEVTGINQATIGPGFERAVSEFRAGQRDVGLKLHRMLREADKAGYMVLISEHSD